jgi:hypothetical protein
LKSISSSFVVVIVTLMVLGVRVPKWRRSGYERIPGLAPHCWSEEQSRAIRKLRRRVLSARRMPW